MVLGLHSVWNLPVGQTSVDHQLHTELSRSTDIGGSPRVRDWSELEHQGASHERTKLLRSKTAFRFGLQVGKAWVASCETRGLNAQPSLASRPSERNPESEQNYDFHDSG